MNQKNLLIVDANEEFTSALREVLQDSYRIEICRAGIQALHQLEKNRPDAMILDPMLPGMDGVTLLQKVDVSSIPPVVLVVTRLAGAYVMNILDQLEVTYVMLKPCEPAAVADRLMELMQMPTPTLYSRDLQERTDRFLRDKGFLSNSGGYQCIREAVLEEMHYPGQQVTKTLYPAVAKICGGSPTRVERAISRQIEQVWKLRREEDWEELFPGCVGPKVKCPTNRNFIRAAAACILTKIQEENTYLREIG